VDGREQTRIKIVECAARLFREQGNVTTRAVAEAAGMQAPTIYRFFEDKDALLDAVAEHVLATYVAAKTVSDDPADPIADLRVGWDTHIDFGLANPALYALMIDPARDSGSPAAAAGQEVLRGRVHRVAAAGRLAVPEHRAVEMIHAAGSGTITALLRVPPERRDRGLADAMWDAITHAILTDAPALPTDDATAAAVAFRAVAPRLTTISDAERTLLTEWLDRSESEDA
jgi:AcrR family transcriptional regulator